MKKIIVQWVQSDADYNKIYEGKEMRVVASDHERFVEGYRFDWGFADIATTQDGFEVIILPIQQ